MLPPFAGKARLAYVEFGDEETMKAGLEKHAEVCLFILPALLPDIFSSADTEGYSTRGEASYGSGISRRTVQSWV